MFIDFFPESEDVGLIVPPPKPASEYIPKWYKNEERFFGGKPNIQHNQVINNSIKACYPYFDALSAGYIQESWADVHIDIDKDNNVIINQRDVPRFVSVRDRIRTGISDEFHQIEFAFRMMWLPKLPDGWSALITSPFNRLDLPFHSTSGVIDSDVFYGTGGDYPFYIKKSFNGGIIPAGTPLYQIIPIKRESWKSRVNTFDKESNYKNSAKIYSNFIGSYKKFFYQKKEYR